MRQMPSTPTTRYEAVIRPRNSDGYPQRIEMWDAVKHLGSATRSELLAELVRRDYQRPNRAPVDEAYCRTELTDMTKRRFLKRVLD